MPVAAPARMSGSSTMARPTRVAYRISPRRMASSTACAPLGEPSRQTSMSLIIAASSSEKDQRDHREQRDQDGQRPEGIAEEAGHAHVVLLGDGLDHEV